MAAVRFIEVQARPIEFLDLTSLTPDEFDQLIEPFEEAFQDHMAQWRLDGKPRTSRRSSVYKNCPLPTPQDRLFFLLTYLKTSGLQVMAGVGLTLVQGRLFGMGQSKANQSIHILLPCLQSTLHRLGDSPSRSVSTLAQQLGVSEADAVSLVDSPEETPTPVEPISSPDVASEGSPLLPMTAPSGELSAPKTLLNRPIVIAARKRTTR